MTKITTIKIHPAIGIARLGNSPSEFFAGPELPGASKAPKGGYKDPDGLVKRQAARFRLFGYDAKGKLVKEITASDGAITWTVHLANKKAAWRTFEGPKTNTPWRNAGVADRTRLIIDPGPRSVSGPNQAAAFNTGTFLGTIVPLGDIQTDAKGHLLVMGGFGNSASPTNKPIVTFANNNGWHDDVSDGPVTALVTFKKSGATVKAVGGWVICAPPDFAPPISHVTTLYDTLLQAAVDKLGVKLPAKPSFTHDIYPILERAISMKWVSMMVSQPHAHDSDEHGSDDHHDDNAHDPDEHAHAHEILETIIPPPGDSAVRKAIFERLRDPTTPPGTESGESDMPMIWSDHYPKKGNQPLTRIQYAMMKKWRNGNFINDWKGPPKPATKITPAGLDRAALEACVGGAFYPGLEAGWFLRDRYAYLEPFRLDQTNLCAGDVTKQLAVPWQADFTECTQEGELAWWPAQRPDDVFPDSGGPQVPWIRDIVSGREDMVANWHRLGFVVKKGSKFLETERTP